MVLRAGSPELGFHTGDHVCAFYNGSSNSLDDIVVDYLSKGLEAGNKCICMVDDPPAVESRIPRELMVREGMLRVMTEEEAYIPDGHFVKDRFLRTMREIVQQSFAEGYEHFRAVGDVNFAARNAIDIEEWFQAEAELNVIVPDYGHFFFCLYDLDMFDGDTVMYVLRTHPRIYVSGIIIDNPHYIPPAQLTG
jgi:MEDS: MEthanogen/methylotroph, DcmR Sensory domain